MYSSTLEIYMSRRERSERNVVGSHTSTNDKVNLEYISECKLYLIS